MLILIAWVTVLVVAFRAERHGSPESESLRQAGRVLPIATAALLLVGLVLWFVTTAIGASLSAAVAVGDAASAASARVWLDAISTLTALVAVL